MITVSGQWTLTGTGTGTPAIIGKQALHTLANGLHMEKSGCAPDGREPYFNTCTIGPYTNSVRWTNIELPAHARNGIRIASNAPSKFL
jgi:hypothetical protein